MTGLGPWLLFRRCGEVEATQIDAPWSWTTEDGETLAARPGDWRVVDTEGNVRSVAKSVFPKLYEPLGGGQFRRTGEFRARQARTEESIETIEGTAVAHPGDWIVEGAEGEQWPVPAEQFERSYELITEGPA